MGESRGRDGTLPAQKDPPMLPSPGFEQRIYSPHTIAAIAAELGEQGIDIAAVLEGTGLATAQLEQPMTKISYRQLDAVMRCVYRLIRPSRCGRACVCMSPPTKCTATHC